MVRATPAHLSASAAQLFVETSPPIALGEPYPSVPDGFMSPVRYMEVTLEDGKLFVMTDCDFHRAAQRMEREGGGFMQKLAALYFHADSSNQRKLRGAFLDEFKRYHRINVAAAQPEYAGEAYVGTKVKSVYR